MRPSFHEPRKCLHHLLVTVILVCALVAVSAVTCGWTRCSYRARQQQPEVRSVLSDRDRDSSGLGMDQAWFAGMTWVG